MTSENVQWNRDSLSSVEGKKLKKKSSHQIERSSSTSHEVLAYSSTELGTMEHGDDCLPQCSGYIELPVPQEPQSKSNSSDEDISNTIPKYEIPPAGTVKKTYCDISDFVSSIKHILDSFVPADEDFLHLNKLQRMEYALSSYRCDHKINNIQFIESVEAKWMFPFIQERMKKIAIWMMHIDEFRLLPLEEKFSIFKVVWVVWKRMETIASSLEIFGSRVLQEQLLVVSPQYAIRTEKFEVDISSITDFPKEYVQNMFKPFTNRMFAEVASPLLELAPSRIEVAYMLCQISWHIAGKDVHESTVEAGDRFREEIAEDLHQYYTDLNLTNYASRLIKLMNVVSTLHKIHIDRQKVVELARLFDVFKIVISEPDIFDC
ncbi:unnamed protein product [Caenorhabditis auriculariae]|uniref:NR LBD domain-containing protein n=1 Tax=Caenorhabditis auriculariae TaxID=2777116 RepID=A0A8S1GU38_9PELO|nr:unnamed protein product [Caenorhabditis auriculariae]